MRDKREHTGRRPQDAIIRSPAPPVPLSFATDDQWEFSSCLSAHCRLTQLLYHHFCVSTLPACAVVDVETRFRAADSFGSITSATETFIRRERTFSCELQL